MLDIIGEIRDRRTNCFGYHNYTQLPLAYAFLSAKTGELHAAEHELDQYVTLHKLDDDEAAKLKKFAKDCVEAWRKTIGSRLRGRLRFSPLSRFS